MALGAGLLLSGCLVVELAPADGGRGGADAGSGAGEDGGSLDAGVSDAGGFDGGALDAGASDAGGLDGGSTDAGGRDASVGDAGGADAGDPAWPPRVYEAEAQVLARGAPCTPEEAKEATGAAAVALESPSDAVEFVLDAPSDGLWLRFSLPDGDGGAPLHAALVLGIDDGGQVPLDVESTYLRVYDHGTWVDGGLRAPFSAPESWDNDPAGAFATYKYFDVARVRLPVKTSRVRVQRAPLETVRVVVDQLMAEAVAPPLPCPGTPFTSDPAPRAGVDYARQLAAALDGGSVVCIPPGRWPMGLPIRMHGGQALLGAGRWHSELVGNNARFSFDAEPDAGPIELGHFFVDQQVTDRPGPFRPTVLGDLSADSHFHDLDVLHALIFGSVAPAAAAERVVYERLSFRSFFAGGLILRSNHVAARVEHVFVDGTGDDATGQWFVDNRGNAFRWISVQGTWGGGNAVAIYGGEDTTVQDVVGRDLARAGLTVSSNDFNQAVPGAQPVRRLRASNVLVERAGGLPPRNERWGAISVAPDTQPLTDVSLSGVVVRAPRLHGLVVQALDSTAAPLVTLTVSQLDVALGSSSGRGVWCTPGLDGGALLTGYAFDGGLGQRLVNESPNFLVVEP